MGEEAKIVQRLRNTAAVFGLGVSAAVTWILTEGASLAGASTRYRSGGAARTQLIGHYGHGTGAGPTTLVSMGANLMAGIVFLLMVTALVFMVVTFIRRRVVTTT
jgi:hypothetical protein